MVYSRIDLPVLREVSGRRCFYFSEGNSSSIGWYLFLKNVVLPSSHHPRDVIQFFRDNQLTWPHLKTGERDQPRIERLMDGHEAVVERILPDFGGEDDDPLEGLPSFLVPWRENPSRSLVERLQGMLRDWAMDLTGFGTPKVTRRRFLASRFALENLRADLGGASGENLDDEEDDGEMAPEVFDASAEESFLPHLREVAAGCDARLTLYRVRRRFDAMGKPQEGYLSTYIHGLREWCHREDVLLVDETGDQTILLEFYADGDHLAVQHEPLFTRYFWDKVGPLLR